MKKAGWNTLKASAFLLLVGLFIVACGKGAAGPEKVAIQFLNHLSNAEYNKAAEICDEDTKGLMLMMAGMANASDAPAEMKEGAKMGAIKILNTDIQGDKAKVTYQAESSDAPEALDLVKVDGKWLVTINKEDLNKEDALKDMESGGPMMEEEMMNDEMMEEEMQ